MVFIFLSYIMDNRNLNLSYIDLYNFSRKYEYYLMDGNNLKNPNNKALTKGVEFISGLIGSTCSFVITLYYTLETGNDYPEKAMGTWLKWRISTDILLTSLAIWGSGRIMKEKPSFINTTIGVLLFDAIATGFACIQAGEWFIKYQIGLIILLPPIGGVIGANL